MIRKYNYVFFKLDWKLSPLWGNEAAISEREMVILQTTTLRSCVAHNGGHLTDVVFHTWKYKTSVHSLSFEVSFVPIDAIARSHDKNKSSSRLQGVPEVLKNFCFCRVTVLWHRLRQTIPQTKENELKFCIFMCGTPRQSGGPRCEPRKNERERARSPSPSPASLRWFSRFPLWSCPSARPVSGG